MAFGAIREMHQPRAAGAALSAEVDDDGATRLCAHVVDPVAVQKVKAGIYKGLSIGGKVLARDADDPSVITSIRLDEISLVDRPCNPEAVIDLWKSQGVPPPAIPTNAEVLAEAEAMARRAGKPKRRNDYVAAAREKLAKVSASPADARPIEPAPILGDGIPDEIQLEALALPTLPISEPAPAGSYGGLAKLAVLESDLQAAQAEIDRLTKGFVAERENLHRQVADQALEIARLGRQALPPRTAGSAFAKTVAKGEDAQAPTALAPDQLAKALDTLSAADRAHLLMKAALAKPMAL
jgi:hypothetical protein